MKKPFMLLYLLFFLASSFNTICQIAFAAGTEEEWMIFFHSLFALISFVGASATFLIIKDKKG